MDTFDASVQILRKKIKIADKALFFKISVCYSK